MSVLILAEHDGKHLKQSTRQAVTAATAWQLPIHIVVTGNAIDAIAQDAASISNVARVIKVDGTQFAHLLAEDVANVLTAIGQEYKVILAAHTAFSKSVLPRAAAVLDVAMISDVISITAPATYVRPIYAANGGSAEITSLDAPAANTQSRWVSEEKNVSDRPELASAHVVISGGRSLGERFNELLDPVALKLNAALGATRACVDAGFAPNDIQVGQTGTIVAPELYIAVGISGAMQHIAGIKDSKVIVAINHDPDAPIFRYADYGLVADLFDALPQLNAALN